MATKHRTYKVLGTLKGNIIPTRKAETNSFREAIRTGTAWQKIGIVVTILTWNEHTRQYEKR
jgi:hypothetical protein